MTISSSEGQTVQRIELEESAEMMFNAGVADLVVTRRFREGRQPVHDKLGVPC